MKKRNKRAFSTDEILNMARRCHRGECNSRCPYHNKENCQNILLKRVYNRLYTYYCTVGELDESIFNEK